MADEGTQPDAIDGPSDDIYEAGPDEKVIIVDIQREDGVKPFVGGFRHKKTGVEYHHAFTQTWVPKEPKPYVAKFHRDAQTVRSTACSIQSQREAGAQTIRPSLFLDETTDRTVVARPYFSSEQFGKLREQKALIIQCYVRGWFARNQARQMRTDLEQRRQDRASRDFGKREAEEAYKQAERERRMHPKTKEDFDILYSELEAWRVQETRRIHQSGLAGDERRAALEQLLYKETKFLQTIDRLKSGAALQTKDERVRQQLQQMAAPKDWTADVHTPFTTRARELLELYDGLRIPNPGVDERLDVLLHIKWTVKEFDCVLTRELVSLIDREADLLNRGRSDKSLSGLRTRISTLFLHFIETPEFNPEAARFQKVPRELLRRPEVAPIRIAH